MAKPNYHDDTFIAKWVSGSLSEAELANFEAWLAENPQEKAAFDMYQTIWLTSGNLSVPSADKSQERWTSLAYRINFQVIGKRIPFYKKTVWKAAGAAAVVLLLVLGHFWLNKDNFVVITAKPGNHRQVTFPDGSTAKLNAVSSVIYNETNWQKERQLILEGEAFFEVKPGAAFSVISDFATTTVLGTSFNIKARSGQVHVACLSGEVRVFNNKDESNDVSLTPGRATFLTAADWPASPFAFDAQQVNGWRSGEFHFEEAPLANVFREIERQFRVQVIPDVRFRKSKFSGKFTNRNLNEALDIICLSSGLRYTIEADYSITIHE